MSKKCTRCELNKHEEEFYKYPNGKLTAACKKCQINKIKSPRNKKRLEEERSGHKICKTCRCIKSIDNFNRHKIRGNLISECKTCLKIRSKKYEEKNYEKRRRQKKEYVKKNKEKLQEYRKQYRLNNLEKTKQAIKQWSQKPENKERKRQQDRHRRKTNPQYRLRMNLSKRVRQFIKKGRGTCTLNLLGCSLIEFKQYIESKWSEGMTWENYGYSGWHIDHIIPCRAFDLTKHEEAKKCFHYTNMQPLWASNNLSKQDRLENGKRASEIFKYIL